MFYIKLDENNRIIEVCQGIELANENKYIKVDNVPKDNPFDYLYIDGKYIYSPLPKPEPTSTITEAERIEALEMAIAELAGEIYNG